MIPALETAGFFVAITAVLHFSTWAERWLASSARSVKERAPIAAPAIAGDFPEPSIEQATVRVA